MSHADESLKKDKYIVLTAAQQNGRAFRYADEILFEDTDFAAGLLDIAEQASGDNKREILQHIHKIPAFQGHITADVNALRDRLADYQEQQNFDVPEELLHATSALEHQSQVDLG